VGESGVVRGAGLVFVDGELWRARRDDGSAFTVGERVRVDAVHDDTLELVVSAPEPAAPAPTPAERT
jgi:membrane protein implicated in regulation of membrane protease activity